MAIGAVRRAIALATSMIALTAAAGCSLLPGSGGPNRPHLERSTLRIGIMPVVDVAPLQIALQSKLFDRAGLQVELVAQSSEADALRQLDSGNLDIAFASDVTMFVSAASGLQLQLQGEAYQAGTNTMALVTLPGSDYTAPGSKKKPKIAVNTSNDIGALTIRSVLQTAGVEPSDIKFSEMPFGSMTAALGNGTVEAAWMVEPFITKAQRSLGAQILTDTARGATLDFPMSSYASSKKFANSYPHTVEAFRNVLKDAQLRATNRLAVQATLPGYAEVDGATAALVSVGTYPVSVNAIRLQRVADMMETSGLLASRLDVQQLLPPGM